MTDTPIERLKELLPRCHEMGGGPWNVSGYSVRICFTDKRVGCEVMHLVKTLAFPLGPATIEPIPSAGEGERVEALEEAAKVAERVRGEPRYANPTEFDYGAQDACFVIAREIRALASLPSEPLRDD